MILINKILLDGLILSVIASLFIFISLYVNPRIWLQDYPKEIQAKVPPKSKVEKRLSLIFGIPFLIVLILFPLISTFTLKYENPDQVSFISLFLNAFGTVYIFNIIDWLLLDWLIFCTITPKFIIIPGTEGMSAYKDYFFHFRGFLVGTVFSLIAGIILALIVWLF